MIDRDRWDDPMVSRAIQLEPRHVATGSYAKGSLLEDTARLHNRGAFMGDLSEPTVNPARPCLCTEARS